LSASAKFRLSRSLSAIPSELEVICTWANFIPPLSALIRHTLLQTTRVEHIKSWAQSSRVIPALIKSASDCSVERLAVRDDSAARRIGCFPFWVVCGESFCDVKAETSLDWVGDSKSGSSEGVSRQGVNFVIQSLEDQKT